jgi:SAM-dependent methyltransferase
VRDAGAAAPWRPRTDCPACGGPLKGWRYAAPGEPGAPSPVLLLRCARCRTAVTAAPPPPAAHDSGAYATASPRLGRAAAPVLALFDRQRLALLRGTLPPPARLLDVGAGRGRFVAAARAAGYDARGLEPSLRGVRAAREAYGVALERAGIEDASVADGSLDAVTLWHVLEHVEDPGAALDRIAGWLRPGAVLLMGVPNVASVQARVGGTRWFHLDLPRHRTHFTPAGLEALLAAHGFAAGRTTHVLAEHNPFGMWQSAVRTRTPSYAYHLLKRNVPVRPGELALTAAALPLVPVAAAAELAAGLRGRGGTIAVQATRRRTERGAPT